MKSPDRLLRAAKLGDELVMNGHRFQSNHDCCGYKQNKSRTQIHAETAFSQSSQCGKPDRQSSYGRIQAECVSKANVSAREHRQ